MSRETSNLGLILYDPSEDKDVKVRDVINKVLGFTDSNTIKIDTKTKDIDANIKTLHDSIIGTDGNVVFYNKQEVFLAVHPVGSIFLSTDGTEPAELYGGTWEQIKDVFLLGAGDTYPAGSTGGEAEHTLTIEEMPNHTHRILRMSWSGKGLDNSHNADYSYWGYDEQTTAPIGDQFISKNGGSRPHNNMPPYYSMYIWRRVA